MTQWTGSFEIADCFADQKPGFKQAFDPSGNEIEYCYLFAGGNLGEGAISVSKSRDGDSSFVLTALGDPGYRIDDTVNFYSIDNGNKIPEPSGPGHQFSHQLAAGARSVTLFDNIATSKGQPKDFYYELIVTDTRNGKKNQRIVLDPTIRNQQLK
jgi:hypothetical protein